MSNTDTILQQRIHAVYIDHHGWLYRWLYRRLRCPHNAADFTHDAFVRLMHRNELDSLREPRAYLAVIAQGLVVDHVRRRELERAYLEAVSCLPEPELPSPETQLLLLEALARIDAMLKGLNPKARTAFLLSRLEGLSYADIAKRLGVSLSSVEKYMAMVLRHCYLHRYSLLT